ncbi:hypothetical protein QTO30_04720 [Yoonia sp. GPGPB17]|uniref:hypothetical protein n=1 Tax=Yoonia sp. GPGPB17 TaxID=3026147 RepID=UPI0030BEAA90
MGTDLPDATNDGRYFALLYYQARSPIAERLADHYGIDVTEIVTASSSTNYRRAIEDIAFSEEETIPISFPSFSYRLPVPFEVTNRMPTEVGGIGCDPREKSPLLENHDLSGARD